MNYFKKHFRLIVLWLLISSSFTVLAQEDIILPKGLAQHENKLITQFQFKSNSANVIPETPIRTAAEWEEIEYLVIRWTPGFQNILLQIVEAAIQECKVLITTENEASVTSFLVANNVEMQQIEFLEAPSNSIWIRDYAGNTGYFNDVENRVLVDWIYNRPRPDDNVMPTAHANYLAIENFSTNFGINDLVNTGGNFMSDGMGTAFASKLILEENEAGNPYGVSAKTETEIDDIMFQFQGINNYIKFDQTPFDPIDHIDMHMKLLDEQTILVSKYPEGIADGPQIEENMEYLINNFQTPFGTNYKIEWIDAPPSTSGLYPDSGGFYRTYTNSVFVNGTVLVPTYRPDIDAPALALYEQLLPGYTIVGIDVDNTNELLIALDGAIHCITHSIGVEEPLLIIHQPKEDVNSPLNIPFNAVVKHVTGINQAKLFWKEQDASVFQEANLTLQEDNIWTTSLSVSSTSSSIDYYIWAEANSGKTITKPYVAPEGFWNFNITTLSVTDWAENNIVGPYPNPTKDKVSFKLNAISGNITISIFNLQGQLLYEHTVHNINGEIILQLKSEWNGTLLVNFTGDFGRITKKIMKL